MHQISKDKIFIATVSKHCKTFNFTKCLLLCCCCYFLFCKQSKLLLCFSLLLLPILNWHLPCVFIHRYTIDFEVFWTFSDLKLSIQGTFKRALKDFLRVNIKVFSGSLQPYPRHSEPQLSIFASQTKPWICHCN